MINIFIISLILGFVFSFITYSFSEKIGLIDLPDGERKTHQGKISLGGGISVFFTCLLVGIWFVPASNFLITLLASSFLILLIGLWDDIKPLPISIRLISQIIASWLVIIITDVYVRDLGNLLGLGNILLGDLGIPLTILMVVGVCNSFNMLDGMDGLVSTNSIITLTALAIISFLNGVNFEWIIVLIGSLIAFSFFNLGTMGKERKMFLGDSGTMTLGHFLGWSIVYWSQGEGALIYPATALWLIIVPLIDALATFVIRIKSRTQIFSGDRNHIHHLLLDSGLGNKTVLIIICSVSIFAVVVAILSQYYLVEESYLFYGFLSLWVFYLLLIKYPFTSNKSKKLNF